MLDADWYFALKSKTGLFCGFDDQSEDDALVVCKKKVCDPVAVSSSSPVEVFYNYKPTHIV
jgi:hypothetical protein